MDFSCHQAFSSFSLVICNTEIGIYQQSGVIVKRNKTCIRTGIASKLPKLTLLIRKYFYWIFPQLSVRIVGGSQKNTGATG